MNTRTEELPTMRLGQQPGPAIFTKQCANGTWLACLASDHEAWRWGQSEAEAVGNLHMAFQGILGVIQQEQ